MMRALSMGWCVVLAPVLLSCGGRSVSPDDATSEGEGEGEGEGDTRALPPFFRLQADAEADDGTYTTTCHLDWHFELREEVTRDATTLAMGGVHGGEILRQFLDDTGAGVVLQGDVFGEVVVTWSADDSFVIEIPINATAIERFYLNLVRLEGTVSADGQRAQGTWTCAPLDIEQGGITDDTVFVDGTWTTEPENVEPEP
jgi:hypothetical protein